MREAMFASFQLLSKEEQTRKIILAGNAEFVIRMLQGQEPTTEVGKAAILIREILMQELET